MRRPRAEMQQQQQHHQQQHQHQSPCLLSLASGQWPALRVQASLSKLCFVLPITASLTPIHPPARREEFPLKPKK